MKSARESYEESEEVYQESKKVHDIVPTAIESRKQSLQHPFIVEALKDIEEARKEAVKYGKRYFQVNIGKYDHCTTYIIKYLRELGYIVYDYNNSIRVEF